MFSILWHPSQWPDLQRLHQFWALVAGFGVIIFVIGMWMHYHVRHTKLTEDGKRDQSNMAELASQHESHHIWPRFLRGIVALAFVATAIIGNFVMYVLNGKQALHHKQTVAASQALTGLLGTQIKDVNTSSKTLTDVLTFDVAGSQLTCPVKRTWSTKDYYDASKYTVSDSSSLPLGVKWEPNSSNVQKLTCPDGKPAQAASSP